MPQTILIVEDEPALRGTLIYNLKKDGFTVEAVGTGRSALDSQSYCIGCYAPELVGYEVTHILRKEMPALILMLTVHDYFDRVALTTISDGKSPSRLPLLYCGGFINSESLGL